MTHSQRYFEQAAKIAPVVDRETLDGLDPALRQALADSPHRLDRALTDLNAHFDPLPEICGLELAA